MSEKPGECPLDRLQRWMQAVITHPAGIEAGMQSSDALRAIDVTPAEAQRVVLPSSRLSSLDRLRVYANAYYARLLECLREEFPAVRHAVGDAAFDAFAIGYLQKHPSTSYTLSELGRAFPQFLAETRPKDEGPRPNWVDLIIDLATVERTYSEVFDGPGVEHLRLIQPEDIAAISPAEWFETRLAPAPCLRLLEIDYPVHEYISSLRRGEAPVVPDAAPTWLVITRRNYVVRRSAVPRDEYVMLSRLIAGERVGSAIEQLMQESVVDMETLAENLHVWFQSWTAAGYFLNITPPKTCH